MKAGYFNVFTILVVVVMFPSPSCSTLNLLFRLRPMDFPKFFTRAYKSDPIFLPANHFELMQAENSNMAIVAEHLIALKPRLEGYLTSFYNKLYLNDTEYVDTKHLYGGPYFGEPH